jgi:hypothetical protein
VPYGEPGSQSLAAAVAAALTGGPDPLPGGVLLERHGAVAIGSGAGPAAVRQAVDRLELVDVLCRTWRDALLVRAGLAVVGPEDAPVTGLSFRRWTGEPDRGPGSPGRDR